MRLRQLCTHPTLCRTLSPDPSSSPGPSTRTPVDPLTEDDAWDLDLATETLAMLRDAGEEACCLCGLDVDGRERIAHIARCGHLYCHLCVVAVFRFSEQLVCNLSDLLVHLVQYTSLRDSLDQFSLIHTQNQDQLKQAWGFTVVRFVHS